MLGRTCPLGRQSPDWSSGKARLQKVQDLSGPKITQASELRLDRARSSRVLGVLPVEATAGWYESHQWPSVGNRSA
jgi:hypothetical protein